MNYDEMAQDRVVTLTNKINEVLAGVPMAEAQTALTLAVTAMIIADADRPEHHMRMVVGHSRHLQALLDNPQIVDWIRASIHPITHVGSA